MFADFRIPNTFGTTLSKIILRVHGKPQPQQSSTAENWLTGPEKNTDSAENRSRLFRGMRKIAELQCASTESFGIFAIFATPLAKVTTRGQRGAVDCEREADVTIF